MIVASGGVRMQEGLPALMQFAKVVEAAGRLAGSGEPLITVLATPSLGGAYAVLAFIAQQAVGVFDIARRLRRSVVQMDHRKAVDRKRVERARAVQHERYAEFGERTNAAIGAPELSRFCTLGREATLLLRNAALRGHLSARGLDRITRVARTIADLAGCESLEAAHLAEAIGYRTLERKGLAA
jgi:hypothetical protein